MAKNKKSLSQTEAQAFKTKAEGQAVLVNAWTPIISLLLLLSAVFIALIFFGVDLTPLLSALLPNLIPAKL